MASGIKEIRERMVQIIERANPDVDPKIKYREISDHIPIEQIPHTGKPNQTTRQFQITAQPVQTEGFLGGCTMDQQQRIRITMRYYVSGSPGDLSRVTDRAASDSARIEADLLLPPHEVSWVGTPLINIDIDGAVPLYASPIDNVWYMGLDYLVMYRLDQDTYGGIFSANYITFADLTEALTGRKEDTTARLIDATTRAVLSTWMVTSAGIEEVNVPTVKTISRVASALPQTAQTPYFTVTGKCMVLKVIGEVTTLVQAQANDIKLVSNPTVGADVDMCAVLDINADTLGTIYTITGTLADAMVATPSGAVQAQISGVDVAAGTIDLSASASSTGATKWTIHYVPINGGTITAA